MLTSSGSLNISYCILPNFNEHSHPPKPGSRSESMSTKTLRPKRIIIGVTGSVATIKLSPLIDCIISNYSHDEVEIKIVASNNALNFFKPADLKPIQVLTDSLEWQDWKRISDPILHVDLRNWADVIVVAPLSANSLAKIANGFCDNLLVFSNILH